MLAVIKSYHELKIKVLMDMSLRLQMSGVTVEMQPL